MSKSHKLFQQALSCMPGGVNSPVRAFYGVGGEPLFIKAAQGAYITDADDQEYLDYVGSWGPMILGHAHPHIVAALLDNLPKGLSFGAPTAVEVELAEKIKQIMPSIEKIRMVNSGTEATMSAIRLARGFTGRHKIIKFMGCYHGHADSLLVQAGSGPLTLGVPDSAGVPPSIAQHTLIAHYNDLDSVQHLLARQSSEIAAIIVEPVAANMNCVLPNPEFLSGLRALCDQHQVILIFDEVMTGFRVALGGAQAYFEVKPDLTTLGKIIGGGLPVGAFGGRAEIMDWLAPIGPVYQAGTLSGNPLAMVAGLATLELLAKPHFYDKLALLTAQLAAGLKTCAANRGIPLYTTSIGSMFGILFTQAQDIKCYQDVMRCNLTQFKQFFHGMLQQGIYLAPSAYEVGFVSAAHSSVEINKTLAAAEQVFKDMVS